ncbi:MAG: hypothetical protein ACRELS_05635 [Candidatus Rokuibacteriota bacterium]
MRGGARAPEQAFAVRILFVLDHYYRATDENPMGLASLRKDPGPRISPLERSLQSLHGFFRRPHLGADFGKAAPIFANTREDYSAEIVVCTSHDDHLLGSISFPRSLYQHVPTSAAPLFLGFECRAVLKDGLPRYDYFCFLEDDIVVNDPWLFDKLRWFSRIAGDTSVLMPNRYELRAATAETPLPTKLYIDMEFAREASAEFQDVSDAAEIVSAHLGDHLSTTEQSSCGVLLPEPGTNGALGGPGALYGPEDDVD